MTKADLVEQVADAVGPRVTRRDCGLVVDAFLDAVKDALAHGEGIELRGFGTFKVRHRKGRKARNPRTGKPVEVPPPARCPSSNRRDTSAGRWTEATARPSRGSPWRPLVSRSLPATTASLAVGGSAGSRPLRCVSQPTQCLTLRPGKGALRPPLDPPASRPAAGAAGGGVRRPPNPVAGAAAERCPVVADDPADVILNGPAAGNLVVTGKGVRFRPWGSPGRRGGDRRGDRPRVPPSPEHRSHGDSGRSGAGWAESEAVGSPVTRELDTRRGIPRFPDRPSQPLCSNHSKEVLPWDVSAALQRTGRAA